jgi:hypothetical protein
MPASQLRSQLAAGKTLGQLAAATPGKSEAGLVTALVAAAKLRLQSDSAKLPARMQALVRGRPAPNATAHRTRVALRASALSYLGVASATLLAKLHSGMTLAQIADATPGKSAAGLKAALLAALKQRLDAKVAAQALSPTAEQRRLAHLESRLGALLQRSHASGGLRAHKPAA